MNKLTGKNVLVFDLETNGLPIRKPGYYDKMSDAYYNYKKNKAYDNCRIVEIGWSYIEGFDKDKIDLENVKSCIRKPTDFNTITNSEFHGITYIPFPVLI
jgi:DNA polymerase III epsilon subunit-like protein